MAVLFEFDPTSESAANSPLEIWSTATYAVTAFSSPAPATRAQWASSVDTEGSLLSSVTHENRQISLTVEVMSAAGLRALQAKFAKVTREGGTAKLTFPNSEVVIFDLLVGDSFAPQLDITYYVNTGTFCTVEMSLTAKPYGRGPEVDLGDNVETTLPALVFTEAIVKGDMPAVGRLVVDNDQATGQLFLTWGLHSKDFISTTLTPLLIQAENTAGGLIVHGTGVSSAAVASASGGNVARSTTLTTTIEALVTVKTYHQGTYRVYARVFAPTSNTGTVSLQLWWSPTVLTTQLTGNDMVDLAAGATPLENAWYLVDLGLVRPRKDVLDTGNVASPNHIFAKSTVAGDDLDIDYVLLVPADEGWGLTTSVIQATPNGVFQVHGRGAAVSSVGAAGPWGTDPKYAGDYLRVPPSGAEGRTVQVVVKLARNATTSGTAGPVIDDSGIDDVSARLYVTPRYLVVPSP